MTTVFKARKRLRAFLLLLAFLICQICLFVSPVQAFTSLNNCAANSACAVTLANKLGLKTAVRNAVATSSPRLISVSGAITKSAVAEVAYGTGTLAFFTGAAVSYAYLSRSEVESLQETAIANFCSQYPDVIVCGNYDLTFYNIQRSKTVTEEAVAHHEITSEQCGWREDFRVMRIFKSPDPLSFTSVCMVPDSLVKGEESPPLPWDDPYWDIIYPGLDASARDVAVETIPDEDFVSALTNEEIISGAELQDLNPNDDIVVDTDAYVGGSSYIPSIISGSPTFTSSDLTSIASNPDTNPVPIPDPSSPPATAPVSGSGTTTTTTTTTKETITIDPDTGEEKVVVEELEETTVEEQEPIQQPLIDPIQPQAFKQKPWMQHGIEVLSTKFPFDIFGDLSFEEISADCPVYTFFQRDFELCVIKDFFAAFKIPAIIGFAIWSYQYI